MRKKDRRQRVLYTKKKKQELIKAKTKSTLEHLAFHLKKAMCHIAIFASHDIINLLHYVLINETSQIASFSYMHIFLSLTNHFNASSSCLHMFQATAQILLIYIQVRGSLALEQPTKKRHKKFNIISADKYYSKVKEYRMQLIAKERKEVVMVF